MAKTVGIGIQSFEEVIEGDYFYIDKTSFMKEWWGCLKGFLFGKRRSTGSFQGTYPLISLSFAREKEKFLKGKRY